MEDFLLMQCIIMEKKYELVLTYQSSESTCNTLQDKSNALTHLKKANITLNMTIKKFPTENPTLHQPLTISIVSTACWHFYAEVEVLKIPLLFDTGSHVSIISKTKFSIK